MPPPNIELGQWFPPFHMDVFFLQASFVHCTTKLHETNQGSDRIIGTRIYDDLWGSEKNQRTYPITDPWDWYIYLHEWLIFVVFMYTVGKYTVRPMDVSWVWEMACHNNWQISNFHTVDSFKPATTWRIGPQDGWLSG